jgi:hypothetical protein
MTMTTRRQFLGQLAGSMVGLFGIATLAGCTKGADDDEDPGPMGPDAGIASNPPDGAVPPLDAMPPTMMCSAISATIGSNHGHTLTVSAADVSAAVEKTYNIKGTSAHPHMVTITPTMFAKLKSDRTLTTMSTTDSSHAHSVTLTCAA